MGRYTRMRPRSLTAEAIAARQTRWAAESGEYRGRGARQLDGALGVLPLHVRFGTATQPHRRLPPPRRRTEHHRRNACGTETTPARSCGRANGAGRHEQTRENRCGQAERVGGRGAAGRDATTIERLIVKGLTRTQAGLDGSSPSLRRRVFPMVRGVERPAGEDRNHRAAVLRAAVDPM